MADADGMVVSGRRGGLAAMIEGFFAIMWFGWGQAAAPSWLTLSVGGAAGAVVAIAGLVLTIRNKGQHTAVRGAAVRRRYNIIIGAEFALLAVGAALLGAVGLTQWIPVWVCAGVGLRFVPLSGVFRHLLLVPLGLLITAVAAVALIVGLSRGVRRAMKPERASGILTIVAS